jgi:hypothetical protein
MNRDEKEMTMEYKTLSEVFDRFDDETRNHAANDLVSALLASCENHKQRIELSINLLGTIHDDNYRPCELSLRNG